MRKFLLKTALYLILTSAACVAIYSYLENEKNTYPEDYQVFMYGDSQMYQGIRFTPILDTLGKKGITFAKHGAGVYGFLRFSDFVDDSSTVLVTFSLPMLMRPKSIDNDRYNLSRDLITLAFKGYSKNDLSTIYHKNGSRPDRIWKETHGTYFGRAENIRVPQSVKSGAFSKPSPYLDAKMELFELAVNRLRKKGCRIIMIQFPHSADMDQVVHDSPDFKKLENFKARLTGEYLQDHKEIYQVDSEEQTLYDFTHLNKTGSLQVTWKVADFLKEQKGSAFLQFKTTEQK